jgi:hypothetical protein
MVEGDLEAGDKVVVEGIQRLREGAAVAEVNATPTIIEESSGAIARESSVGPGAQPAAEPVPASTAAGRGRLRS